MKTLLLFLGILGFFAANAQTTYNLDWFTGIGSDVDLTIDQGDTVIWTWGDELPHTVENEEDSSVEEFNSGVLTGIGQTFSYTFTVVGENEYFCGVHGSSSMSGTITVNEVLGVGDNDLNSISLYPNPASTSINLELPKNMQTGQIIMYNILGKQISSQEYDSEDKIAIDVMNLSTGSYFLKVVSANNTQSLRFIKN